MTLKKELITKAAFNREIEKMDADQSLTKEFINKCDCDPNNKRKRRLKYTYGIVQGIDLGLRNNIIQNKVPALRMRKIALSMTIGHMTRNGFVDIDILDAENISLVEVGEKYTHDYHRTQLMVETIQNNQFIQNAIHELAKDGKLFKSKNHDKILEIEEKLDELEVQLTGTSPGMKLIHNNKIRLLEEKLYNLKQDEFLNGDFSIEDICFKVVADWKRNTLRDAIWYLSKTSQNKLIDLIVKSYKSMKEDEISEYRTNKNKDYKKEYMKKYNKKTFSAEDKRELVQRYKADGLSPLEVAVHMDCSVRIVQYYWNTAS